MKKIAFKGWSLICVLVLFVSCDKDYNTIGSDVIGGMHTDLLKKTDVSIVAYSKATGPVQSNNLPINSLGVYDDPFFGKSTSTFVSQLELTSLGHDFGAINEIQATDSVYLYVPYLSNQTATGTGNDPNTFELLSVYGDESLPTTLEEQSLDLKVYESNVFLRTFDNVDPTQNQRYFSNEKAMVEGTLGGNQPLNDATNVAENSEFKFLKDEIIIYKTDGNGAFLDSEGNVTTDLTKRVVKERLAPGMWINLNKLFFENKILGASASDLTTNTNFREYFKGLYFKVSENGTGKSNVMALMDFSKGYVMVQYHTKENATDDFEKKSFRMNLKGNTVNFFENNFKTDYTNGLANSNQASGDAQLYVRGGEGSMVYLDIFGEDADNTGIPDELEDLRNENILINDAYITFYIDNQNQKNPLRIFLFDATNNIPLLDYIYDNSVTTDAERNKFLYSGIVVEESGVETKYKIKISSHILNLVRGTNPDANKNVRLGLSVTQNINNGNSYKLAAPIVFGTDDESERLPIGSVMSPLGVVLYGSHSSTPSDKKIKMEIYYTKTN